MIYWPFHISVSSRELFFQTTDSVKLHLQKVIRERDQANTSAMQIRTDFEKLLVQSNQVEIFF